MEQRYLSIVVVVILILQVVPLFQIKPYRVMEELYFLHMKHLNILQYTNVPLYQIEQDMVGVFLHIM